MTWFCVHPSSPYSGFEGPAAGVGAHHRRMYLNWKSYPPELSHCWPSGSLAQERFP